MTAGHDAMQCVCVCVCSASLAPFQFTVSLMNRQESGPGKPAVRRTQIHGKMNIHTTLKNTHTCGHNMSEDTKRLLTKLWNKLTTLTQTVNKHMCCSCMHAHTHTNQYAEPELLHSLITASFTAAPGFNASLFRLPLKCPENWVCEEGSLFEGLREAA